MFCYSPKRPINLQSFARWTLVPALKKAGIPWKTWHGFRRGNATYLAQQQTGNGVRMAQIALRHSDPGVTQDHYVKESKQQKRARAAFAKLEIEQLREKASGVIGQGLRVN